MIQIRHNSSLRQQTQPTIWGEFDPYAFLLRLYAPSPDAMEESLPPPPEEAIGTGMLTGEYYRPPDDWSRLLYVSNFVHECSHYWQYAARPFLINVYSLLTQQAQLTYELVNRLRHPFAMPVRLPLVLVASSAPQDSTLRNWFAAWGTLETAYCAAVGYDSSPAGEYLRKSFDAFRKDHAMPHLPETILPQIASLHGQEDVTMRALHENEAFANELFFIWSHYGEEVVLEVMKLLYGESTTRDYGGLLFGWPSPVYMYPLAMELATSGLMKGEWKTQHPCWRFVGIARALQRIDQWKDQKCAWENFEQIVAFLQRESSIGDTQQSLSEALDYVLDSEHAFLPHTRRLLARCIEVKQSNFLWFAFPTIYFWEIIQHLPMPFVTYGTNSEKYYSVGDIPSNINLEELLEEVWFVAAARELALSSSVTCPICHLSDTEQGVSRLQEKHCTGECAWSAWFARTWGCYVGPEKR